MLMQLSGLFAHKSRKLFLQETSESFSLVVEVDEELSAEEALSAGLVVEEALLEGLVVEEALLEDLVVEEALLEGLVEEEALLEGLVVEVGLLVLGAFAVFSFFGSSVTVAFFTFFLLNSIDKNSMASSKSK